MRFCHLQIAKLLKISERRLPLIHILTDFLQARARAANKPCLQRKEALLALQRSLVYNAKKPYLQHK